MLEGIVSVTDVVKEVHLVAAGKQGRGYAMHGCVTPSLDTSIPRQRRVLNN